MADLAQDAARRFAREEARGLRAALYPVLCAAQLELHRKPDDTPACDAQLCSLMREVARAMQLYRRGARDVRDRLIRISLGARLDDLEFLQRTLTFWLASPPARPLWM